MSDEEKKDTAAELTDADMPPVESLSEGADVSAFFAPGVSDALRKRALRTVFRQGRFNIRDGLDDYDEDYSSFPPLAQMTAEMRKLLTEKRQAEESASAKVEPDSGAELKTESALESDSNSNSEAESERTKKADERGELA